VPSYAYVVRDRQGKILKGIADGENQEAVITKLRRTGYVITRVSLRSQAKSLSQFLEGVKRVKARDLAIFSRQFATMIHAGLPLTKCLSILVQQTSNQGFKKVIEQIQRDVESGQPLSSALARHPKAFSGLFVSMVKAGETGGILDDVLMRLADHLEKEVALKQKIKSSTTYPVLMFAFAIIMVFFMVTFIVPIFASMFQNLGGALPAPTRVLMTASGVMRSYWYMVFASMGGLVYLFKRFISTTGGRYWFDKTKLRLPIVGKLIQKSVVARFTRTLGTLINSGVPILGALEIVAATAGNAVVAKAMEEVRSSIKEGETIAKPLEESRVFPPMVVQMIAVGEETGALDVILQKVADFYDEEVTSAVDSLTSIIEPIMLVFIGVVVGGILMSLYLPMFNVINLIK
jgi:type IV pilus assembly protein PilC